MSVARVSHTGKTHRGLAWPAFVVGAAVRDFGEVRAEAVIAAVDGDAHCLRWLDGFG